MNWQRRILVLILIGIPAFTGLSPLAGLGAALPGVSWAAFIYAAAVNIVIVLTCGGALAAGVLAVSVLILLPVVLGGASITWILTGAGWMAETPAGVYGAHYVRLVLNMLAVIPLALSIVATIPFGRLEQHLLRDDRGVSRWEKKLLMAVRVFNHIAFFVIPNLLEVVREEMAGGSRRQHASPGLRRRLATLTAGLIQIGVAGICGALRFIPLWAHEIAALPDRRAHQDRSTR